MSADPTVGRLKRRFTLWMALMPLAIFALVFAALCAYECTAAPWLTFLVAPAVSIAWALGLIFRYLGLASALPDSDGAALRRFVLWSFLWGPIVAGAAFYAAVAAVSLLSIFAPGAKTLFGGPI